MARRTFVEVHAVARQKVNRCALARKPDVWPSSVVCTLEHVESVLLHLHPAVVAVPEGRQAQLYDGEGLRNAADFGIPLGGLVEEVEARLLVQVNACV
jgi:hypothetical protein